MTKQIGDIVNFERTPLIKKDNARIEKVSIAKSIADKSKITNVHQVYLIEHTMGLSPSRYGITDLDSSKKYLFVKENELTP